MTVYCSPTCDGMEIHWQINYLIISNKLILLSFIYDKYHLEIVLNFVSIIVTKTESRNLVSLLGRYIGLCNVCCALIRGKTIDDTISIRWRGRFTMCMREMARFVCIGSWHESALLGPEGPRFAPRTRRLPGLPAPQFYAAIPRTISAGLTALVSCSLNFMLQFTCDQAIREFFNSATPTPLFFFFTLSHTCPSELKENISFFFFLLLSKNKKKTSNGAHFARLYY